MRTNTGRAMLVRSRPGWRRPGVLWQSRACLASRGNEPMAVNPQEVSVRPSYGPALKPRSPARPIHAGRASAHCPPATADQVREVPAAFAPRVRGAPW